MTLELYFNRSTDTKIQFVAGAPRLPKPGLRYMEGMMLGKNLRRVEVLGINRVQPCSVFFAKLLSSLISRENT